MSVTALAQQPIDFNYTIPDTEQLQAMHAAAQSCQLTAQPGLRLINVYFQMGYAGTRAEMYARTYLYHRLQQIAVLLQPAAGLLILDVFRSLQTQTQLFACIKQQLAMMYPDYDDAKLQQATREFVYLPSTVDVPPHNSGGAVDLAIYDQATGQPWDFGTAFDATVPLSHSDFFERPREARYGIDPMRWQTIRDNRRILHHLMRQQGFVGHPNEWWHFDLGDRLWANALGTTPIYASMQQAVDAQREPSTHTASE